MLHWSYLAHSVVCGANSRQEIKPKMCPGIQNLQLSLYWWCHGPNSAKDQHDHPFL